MKDRQNQPSEQPFCLPGEGRARLHLLRSPSHAIFFHLAVKELNPDFRSWRQAHHLLLSLPLAKSHPSRLTPAGDSHSPLPYPGCLNLTKL